MLLDSRGAVELLGRCVQRARDRLDLVDTELRWQRHDVGVQTGPVNCDHAAVERRGCLRLSRIHPTSSAVGYTTCPECWRISDLMRSCPCAA